MEVKDEAAALEEQIGDQQGVLAGMRGQADFLRKRIEDDSAALAALEARSRPASISAVEATLGALQQKLKQVRYGRPLKAFLGRVGIENPYSPSGVKLPEHQNAIFHFLVGGTLCEVGWFNDGMLQIVLHPDTLDRRPESRVRTMFETLITQISTQLGSIPSSQVLDAQDWVIRWENILPETLQERED